MARHAPHGRPAWLRAALAAIVLAVPVAGPAAQAQAPVRIEIQAVSAPRLIGFAPRSATLLWIQSSGERIQLLDFADPALPVVRLTLPVRAPAAALFPDGRIIVAGRDGKFRFFTDSGAEAAPAAASGDDTIASLAVSASGRLIATVNEDGAARLWAPDGRALTRPLDTPRARDDECDNRQPHAPVFSPDETLLAFAGRCGRLDLWTTRGERVAVPDGERASVRAVAFTPDGAALAVRYQYMPGAETFVWPVARTGRLGAPRRPPRLQQVAFAAFVAGFDSGTLAATDGDGVRFTAIDGRETAPSIRMAGARDLALSADRNRLAIADDRRIRLWTRAGAPLAPTPFADFPAGALTAAAPDAGEIAVAHRDGRLDRWTAAGAPLPPLRLRPPGGAPADPRALAYTPDGRLLVAQSRDGTILAWTRDGKRLGLPFRPAGPAPTDAGARPAADFGNARLLAAAADGRRLQFYFYDGRSQGAPFAAAAAPIVALAFSETGALAAMSDGATLTVWNLDGTRRAGPLPLDPGRTGPLRFSPDGRVLVLADDAAGIHLVWRLDRPDRLDRRESRFLGFVADGGLATQAGSDLIVTDLDGEARLASGIGRRTGVVAVKADSSAALLDDGSGPRWHSLKGADLPPPPPPWIDTHPTAVEVLGDGRVRAVFDTGQMLTAAPGEAPRFGRADADLIDNAAFSRDGERMAFVAGAGLRDLTNGEGVLVAERLGAGLLRFAPGARTLAATVQAPDQPPVLRVLDWAGRTRSQTVLPARPFALEITPDGALIAIAVDGAIVLADGNGTLLPARIETGTANIGALVLAPDGTWVGLIDEAHRFRRWSAAGAALPVPPEIAAGTVAVRVSEDGKVLAAAGAAMLRLYAVEAPDRLVPGAARPIAVSPYRHFALAGTLLWIDTGDDSLAFYGADLAPVAELRLFVDGYVAHLPDGRHCGFGPAFETRRVFRGETELAGAARTELADCPALRAALGAPRLAPEAGK